MRALIVTFLATTLITSAFAAAPPVAPSWLAYEEARKTGKVPELPEFSYSGYRYGEVGIPRVGGKTFAVTDFGAVPNDLESDEPAIRKAIAAAEENGGGIVLFSAGEFLVNTAEDEWINIQITRPANIVLRGAGMQAGGTIIKMVRNFEAANPAQMYSTPFLFLVKPEGLKPAEQLASVTADTPRGRYSVVVDSAKKIRVGDHVTLKMKSLDAVGDFLAPHQPDPTMTRLLTGGIEVTERHLVTRVVGDRVFFREPLQSALTARYGWTIESFDVAENFGVEDIAFIGNWRQPFIHHRTALDDGGWGILRLERLGNSWVRRCAFLNINHGIEMRDCVQSSMLMLIFDGFRGHFCMHARAGYGVLGGLLDNRTNSHHGPSVGYQGTSTVYWRNIMQPNQRVDSHSGQPIATLHDAIQGGNLYGSGGPTAGLPHHLRGWTLWNFDNRGTENSEYDFWSPKKKDRFVMPIVVGWHGNPVAWKTENMQLLESNGTAVSPESLYEAQLTKRLGSRPAWLDETLSEWEKLRVVTLPEIPRPMAKEDVTGSKGTEAGDTE